MNRHSATDRMVSRRLTRALTLAAGAFAWLSVWCGGLSHAGPPARIDPPGAKDQATPTSVSYKGRVVDDAGKPVSGIFPMTFKLYAGLKARKPIWSESWWIAVDNGIYRVVLGEKKALPARADLSKMVLGVEIQGVGEVVREPFQPDRAVVESSGGPAVHPLAKGGVKYADSAGFAVEADHAKNSDRLQNLTLEDLTRKVIEESGGAAAKGVRIGKARRYGNRVGGPGGSSEYNEVCPPGMVMVGIRGGAGIYLDSIQIICAPLE